MGVETALVNYLGTTAGSLGWFFPALAMALAYFQYDVMDKESQPIDMPTELLHPNYDFIIVGAGSAGKNIK